jgi:hypothetical protein
MVDARLIRYIRSAFIEGSLNGDSDRGIGLDSTLVYVPSERVLVDRNQQCDLSLGPITDMYDAFVDEEAETKYGERITALENAGCRVEEVNVTPEFVEWARALNRVKRPSRDITQLLIGL